jgi:enoyl-CoA hydratase/carnithine racemase
MFELVLSGPGKNSLGTAMMTHILAQLDAAAGQPLLLRGEGDAFSAGLDLREVAMLDADGMATFLRLLERCMSALYQYPGPTVALVNGHAIAGGCVLALCCDARIAARTTRAKIGLNEVALGLRFPPRVFAIVRARIPRQFHSRVLLGAGLFDPAAAHSLGLLDEIVDGDANAVARAQLEALAKSPAQAYAATKHDLRGAVPTDLCSDAEQDRWFRDELAPWISPSVRAHIASMFAR